MTKEKKLIFGQALEFAKYQVEQIANAEKELAKIKQNQESIVLFMQGLYDSCENEQAENKQNLNILQIENKINNCSNEILNEFATKKEQIEMIKYNNKTITKTKNRKLWQLRYRQNGKQYTVYGKTQKDCIYNYKQALKNKNTTINKKITLKEWYNEFLNLYKINKVKDTTIKALNYDFEKLKKIYNYEINKLTPIIIQNELNKIPYKSTQNRIYIILNSLFEKALQNEIINKNIIKLVDRPKYKAEQKTSLTKQEENLFIESCKNHKFGDYYLICLYQGLRKGEARALKVNDVDLENNTLRIDESLNTHTTDTSTKNQQSNRTMPIFEKAKEILINHMKNKKQNEYLFDIGINRVDKAIKEIVKNANIRNITTHILRHTFITRCQELNIPLYIIQSWVGHEKGSVVTTKIYTHLNQDTNLKYVDLLNKSNK